MNGAIGLTVGVRDQKALASEHLALAFASAFRSTRF